MLTDIEIARYRPFMDELGIDLDLALYLHNAMGLIVAEEIRRAGTESGCGKPADFGGFEPANEVQLELNSLKKTYNDAA
ncbi:MAG: hypothetical protein IT546_00040 [Caulobacteraceae bacterium]|nr:hypothetical protein [Caulobacteraceae bacterium]